MENKTIEYRLNEIIYRIENEKNKKDDTKTKLELAKLKLLKSDPKFLISDELELINQGKISLALISFIDKTVVLPKIINFFTRKKGK